MIVWWLLLTVLLAVIYYVKNVFSYWERKGFPVFNGSIPFGCLGPCLREKLSMGEVFRDIHLNSKEPIMGIYLLFRPALLIRDPILVKSVLISEFNHFSDRGIYFDAENDPMASNLFTMPGQPWKEMRSILSPMFSTGKLRNMFDTIQDKNQLLKNYLEEQIKSSDQVKLKQALVKLNISIMASVFFGFELDAFENPGHIFSKLGQLHFDPTTLRNKVSNIGTFLCPTLLKMLKMPSNSPTVTKYLISQVRTVMEARTAIPTLHRKDFIEIVMGIIQNSKSGPGVKLTVDQCAAQAFTFYIGGYETSASTTAYCIFELCHSPVWMRKAKAEVDALMMKREGKIQYEDLADLKILNMCVKETLRKYPLAAILNRQCTREFSIPGTDQVIEKGTPIIISSFGLHMDPEHFPDPENFDPSRFEADHAANDIPYYPVSRKIF